MSPIEAQDVYYRVVTARELDRFLTEAFNRPFSVEADQELTAEGLLEVDVRQPRLTRFELEDITSWTHGQRVLHVVAALMKHLAIQGKLDAALYLVKVIR